MWGEGHRCALRGGDKTTMEKSLIFISAGCGSIFVAGILATVVDAKPNTILPLIFLGVTFVVFGFLNRRG